MLLVWFNRWVLENYGRRGTIFLQSGGKTVSAASTILWECFIGTPQIFLTRWDVVSLYYFFFFFSPEEFFFSSDSSLFLLSNCQHWQEFECPQRAKVIVLQILQKKKKNVIFLRFECCFWFKVFCKSWMLKSF